MIVRWDSVKLESDYVKNMLYFYVIKSCFETVFIYDGFTYSNVQQIVFYQPCKHSSCISLD